MPGAIVEPQLTDRLKVPVSSEVAEMCRDCLMNNDENRLTVFLLRGLTLKPSSMCETYST